MDDSQNAQSLTCSARIRLQGGAGVSGDISSARVTAMACKPLHALQGDTVSQAWCMHHETPATPLSLSQRERGRTAVIRCRELRKDK